MSNRIILRLNGIPSSMESDQPPGGFEKNGMGEWVNLNGDLSLEIEDACVRLHGWVAEKLFGNIDQYHRQLPFIPPFLDIAGLNSESSFSRDQFEKYLVQLKDFPDLNKILYLQDVRKLISAIQESTKEVKQLVGEFYRLLNCEPFFIPAVSAADDVRWSTSPAVTMLWATLGIIFIRLHSLLDYTAKLAREAEGLLTDFKKYPKLVSSNFMFGSRNKLKINNTAGSLFEDCPCVHEIELIRNHIIHDGLLDDMPKGYEVYKDGVIVERYILMPDKKDRQFEKFVNRRLFYSIDDKINLRLPDLVQEFQKRLVVTLGLVLSSQSI